MDAKTSELLQNLHVAANITPGFTDLIPKNSKNPKRPASESLIDAAAATVAAGAANGYGVGGEASVPMYTESSEAAFGGGAAEAAAMHLMSTPALVGNATSTHTPHTPAATATLNRTPPLLNLGTNPEPPKPHPHTAANTAGLGDPHSEANADAAAIVGQVGNSAVYRRFEQWNSVTKKRRVEILIDRKRQHAMDFGDRRVLERDGSEMAQFARASTGVAQSKAAFSEGSHYFFPEFESPMSVLPPCPGQQRSGGAAGGAGAGHRTISEVAGSVGNAATNPVLRNLERLARIKSVRKFLVDVQADPANSNGGRDVDANSKPTEWDFSSPPHSKSTPVGVGGGSSNINGGGGGPAILPPDALPSIGMPQLMQKSAALMLAQAGYEDCHVGALNVLVEATERFCLTLGKVFRTFLDEGDLKMGEESAARSAVKEMTRGGLPALDRYWKWDVLEYGARFLTEIYTRGCHWIPRMFA
jgi:hypothetical protein